MLIPHHTPNKVLIRLILAKMGVYKQGVVWFTVIVQEDLMKMVMFALISIMVLLGGLWYAVGGIVLAIGFGIIVGLVLVLSLITLGAFLYRKTLMDGLNIALDAQRVNDKWDIDKTNAIGNIATAGIQAALPLFKREAERESGFVPLLMSGEQDVVDGLFEVQGVEGYEEE